MKARTDIAASRSILSPLDVLNTDGYPFRIRHNSDESADLMVTQSPPGALTDDLAGAGAGALTAGAYTYKVTFVTAGGETDGGTVSGGVTVADPAVDGQVALSGIPTGSPGIVTSRKIYRTIANGSAWLLQSTIANNTATTATDNVADAALGAAIPTTNTATDAVVTIRKTGEVAQLYSQDWAIRSVSADTTLDSRDYIVLVDATAAARTITLPAVSGLAGRIYTVKKTAGAVGNTVTVDGAGAETIDGAANQIIIAALDSLTMICDGATWWLV